MPWQGLNVNYTFSEHAEIKHWPVLRISIHILNKGWRSVNVIMVHGDLPQAVVKIHTWRNWMTWRDARWSRLLLIFWVFNRKSWREITTFEWPILLSLVTNFTCFAIDQWGNLISDSSDNSICYILTFRLFAKVFCHRHILCFDIFFSWLSAFVSIILSKTGISGLSRIFAINRRSTEGTRAERYKIELFGHDRTAKRWLQQLTAIVINVID